MVLGSSPRSVCVYVCVTVYCVCVLERVPVFDHVDTSVSVSRYTYMH